MNPPMLVIAAVVMVAAGPVTSSAQERKPYPTFTADHFVGAMKTAGQAFAAVNISLTKNEIEDAKAYLAISRDRLATTITFWRDRGKGDAIKMLRDTLVRLDELDLALSVDQVDHTAVGGIMKQVGTACQACHAAYRDQDPASQTYRFKVGSVQ
jgi:hypothetical protein